MANDALPEEWETIREWLPEDLDARARHHQFFQRERGLTDGERWLRLILMHVAGGPVVFGKLLAERSRGLIEQFPSVGSEFRNAFERIVARLSHNRNLYKFSGTGLLSVWQTPLL
jgi:hypothetical protein